jgi:hypothetical protein
MLLEEQRYLHEDLERLESGISERIAEDPKHVQILKNLLPLCLNIIHSHLGRYETV